MKFHVKFHETMWFSCKSKNDKSCTEKKYQPKKRRHRPTKHAAFFQPCVLGVNYPFKVVEKVREMSFGLPNMSEMLKYADEEMKEANIQRRGSLKSEKSKDTKNTVSGR